MPETIIIRLTVDQAEAVIDACNCASVAADGDVEGLRGAFMPSDAPEMGSANAMIARTAERAQEVAAMLRPEVEDSYKRNPEVQELLHRFKMARKYGRIPRP